jgi:LPXTG-site transpeptidase (sortase) family protein
MDNTSQRDIVWMAFAAVGALCALALFIAAVPSSDVTTFSVRRIRVSAPLPPAEAVAQGCPELNNPGGKVDWRPVRNAGPVPTNGRVQLPALGVEAPIVRVGIDSSQRMVVPTNARDIAWLDQGGIPGRTQNVVLAGHIAYSRAAGSFNRIRDLQPGDDVILRIDDKTLRYRVVWNCQFHRDTTLADRIMGYTTVPSVTLISCGGVFDTAARTHTDRITVRAELVTSA